VGGAPSRRSSVRHRNRAQSRRDSAAADAAARRLAELVTAAAREAGRGFDEILDGYTLHQLLELERDRERSTARQELIFLRSIRLAVPASLDSKHEGDFRKRETELLKLFPDNNG
jgi:hypothetical protein